MTIINGGGGYTISDIWKLQAEAARIWYREGDEKMENDRLRNRADDLLYELVYQTGGTYIADLRFTKKEQALKLLSRKKEVYIQQYGEAAFREVNAYIQGAVKI